ncbi:hypothetical protein DSECCO2_191430 [anaerobic digester metagenome]
MKGTRYEKTKKSFPLIQSRNSCSGGVEMSSGASIRGVRDPEAIQEFVRRLSCLDPERREEPRAG